MKPTLTWLDLTCRDRSRMQRVLDLFGEQRTVDEMGLGRLRDAISDELFPGTSSIQTRLRYMLFVPWIYGRLEAQPIPNSEISQKARAAELALIDPLTAQKDNSGVIGAQARNSLKRLPSAIYWAGLVRWGIFGHGQSQSWYHTHFARCARDSASHGRADDPGIVWSREPSWHPRLPAIPPDFPARISFDLTQPEADFLRGRIEERCAGSLLAWLAREGSAAPAPSFWKEPSLCQAGPKLAHLVELARRFSLHVEGTPLLYNLMLAERRHAEHGGEEPIDTYREELAQWAKREKVESPFEAAALWRFVAHRGGRLPDPQRRFVESWSSRIAQIGPQAVPDDAELRILIERREIQLKGGRARLMNAGRLLDWSGRVGVGRMDFRWFRVRQLMIDLHQGLEA